MFPELSFAVQVTCVNPKLKTFGESFVSDSTPITSLAVALPIGTAVPDGPVASIVISWGKVISGEVVSITDTSWVAVEVFPDVSFAVQVTVV